MHDEKRNSEPEYVFARCRDKLPEKGELVVARLENGDGAICKYCGNGIFEIGKIYLTKRVFDWRPLRNSSEGE